MLDVGVPVLRRADQPQGCAVFAVERLAVEPIGEQDVLGQEIPELGHKAFAVEPSPVRVSASPGAPPGAFPISTSGRSGHWATTSSLGRKKEPVDLSFYRATPCRAHDWP